MPPKLIEINLLPKELQKRKTPAGLKSPEGIIINGTKVFLAGLILFQVLLQILILINILWFKHLDKVWSSMQSQKKQVDQVKEEFGGLKNADTLFLGLVDQRLAVAPLLNGISDAITPGVWLSGLALTKSNLEIKGNCVSSSAQELVLIGEFLTALKKDKGISKAFPHLAIISSGKKTRIGAVDIADFVISSK